MPCGHAYAIVTSSRYFARSWSCPSWTRGCFWNIFQRPSFCSWALQSPFAYLGRSIGRFGLAKSFLSYLTSPHITRYKSMYNIVQYRTIMIGYRFWISAGTFLIVPHLLNHFFDFLSYFTFPDGGIGQFECEKDWKSMHLKTKSWQHMTAPSSSTCSVCSWWTSCCAFAMRFSVWWCCVAFPGIRFQAEIGRVLRFSHSHIAHSPDTFQRERQRGRGWEVLICFDNFGKIITYSLV